MFTESDLGNVDTFYKLISIVKTGIYWKDKEGRYLGCNDHLLKMIGLINQGQVIGKTDEELWSSSEENISAWTGSDRFALTNGRCEIEVFKIISDEKKHFSIVKTWLTNKSGNAIGILGSLTEITEPISDVSGVVETSLDITGQKEAESFKLEIALHKTAEKDHQMTQIIDLVNASIYWKDKAGRYLGCNKYVLNMAGVSDRSQIVGKTDAELVWRGVSAKLMEVDNYVINHGRYSGEELMTLANGSTRPMLTVKNQLIDSDGNVVGVIGTSLEITAQKEAERLRFETQKVALQEQEKLITLAHTVAHDISSPLSALTMIIPLCDELPENKRVFLNKATEAILDIANNLLNTYRPQNPTISGIESRQPLLVSDLLIQLLSEKKVQYQQHPVRFETELASDAHFAFIYMQKTEFRRAMSNLINNAVDALESKRDGKVTIQLSADVSSVTLKVHDNGKGMSSDQVDKMRKHQSFTEGKDNGHGLGLQQVWETLKYNQGIIEVTSVLGKGTAIQLTFPRVTAEKWIAQDIYLTVDNIIVILDDDESIHAAWNLRLTPFLASCPTLQIHHFTQGNEVQVFLATLSKEEKNRMIFLSDYELLRQNRNGLEIVEASGIKRSILVTSYYSDPEIQEATARLEIKLLPKQMASIIPIYMAPFIKTSSMNT